MLHFAWIIKFRIQFSVMMKSSRKRAWQERERHTDGILHFIKQGQVSLCIWFVRMTSEPLSFSKTLYKRKSFLVYKPLNISQQALRILDSPSNPTLPSNKVKGDYYGNNDSNLNWMQMMYNAVGKAINAKNWFEWFVRRIHCYVICSVCS